MAELIGIRIQERANGAEVAIMMVHVGDWLADNSDGDSDAWGERFTNMWMYTKNLMNTITESKITMMKADAEAAGGPYQEKFTKRITDTVNFCIENLDDQQIYIDMSRELMKTGLFSAQ